MTKKYKIIDAVENKPKEKCYKIIMFYVDPPIEQKRNK